ncbi:MAG: hypothetical protein IPM68_14595 [Flavobacteriales bacterium]|nr:hypothetical protein [Flavobacteriales bacterium]
MEHTIGRLLGVPVRLTNDVAAFRDAAGPRLSYGTVPIDGALHVPWSGALAQLPSHDPPTGMVNDMPVLFPVGASFDLFAAAFFLLALVDEQRCAARDAHDRIPSEALFTVRSGLADRPWIDRWLLELGDRLRERWPVLELTRTYRHILTVDVDNMLRYAGRPWTRALGATLKDLALFRPGAMLERWMVRTGLLRDPYLSGLDRVERHARDTSGAILFLLLRSDGPHDHAVEPDRWPAGLHRFLRHDTGLRIGLHPSYASSTDPGRLEAEVSMYERRLQPRTLLSRQHFLRWRLPDTLRRLAAAGFIEEHSLGFSDRTGFRAATCTPFPWYDLERDRPTSLMLWPFAAMDSALIERSGLDPDGVTAAMRTMSDEVRAVQGTFVSVWHDRYLSGHREFARWPAVFDHVVKHARP